MTLATTITLLTFTEAASRLRKTESSLRWMMQTGTAPKHAKIGGRIYFRETDVNRYIEEAFQAAS